MSKRIENIIKYKNKTLFKTESIYDSKWVTKFINKLMQSGKKARIEKMVYNNFSILKFQIQPYHYNTVAQFLTIKLELIKSVFELKVRRRGRQFIYVPCPLKPRRQLIKALSSLVYQIRKKRGFQKSLQTRMLAAFLNLNQIKDVKLIKERNSLYDKVIKNKNNTRFRWV